MRLELVDLTRVVELPKAVAMIKRAYQLDKTYANAAPAFLLALINGSQGKAMGGDPDAAKRLFDEAISLTEGKYLLAKVMFAQRYARLVFDRELHDRLLHEVLETDPRVPGLTLLNLFAQEQARQLLGDADEYF